MSITVTDSPRASLPDDEHYERNFIGGRWQFPIAPYEYEIRNPIDSTITAVVPLSSRFDVAAAVRAAEGALTDSWGSTGGRVRLLGGLLKQLETHAEDLAGLQSLETGLSLADSMRATELTLRLARSTLRCSSAGWQRPRVGVTGHILSWGLPFNEIVSSVLPVLVRGSCAVVKPSLRAPLSAVAFALLAEQAGLPPGVVNIVQGTGIDVGADMMSRGDLSALEVRGNRRTISQAQRSASRTGVELRTLSAGGNVVIAGPGADLDLAALLDTVVAGVRVNSAGGPLAVPLLAVHDEIAEEVTAALVDRLSDLSAAPLPTEPLREQARSRTAASVAAGAELLLGGYLPDDIEHRMGWRLPATVLGLGPMGSAAQLACIGQEPLGPVLSVTTWRDWSELATLLGKGRLRDGIASPWGLTEPQVEQAESQMVIGDATFAPFVTGSLLAPGWTGQSR